MSLATDFLFPTGTLLVVLVFMLVGLVMTALWVWSLVDALRISDPQWAAAGQNKMLWVILIAVLGLLGSLLYVVMARPSLTAARGGLA